MINSVAKILKFIAISIFILGFISGIILGISNTYHIIIILYIWIICFLTGMFFYAISEIIELQAVNIDNNARIIDLLTDIKLFNETELKSKKTSKLNDEITEQSTEPFTWRCTNCGELNLAKNNNCKKCNYHKN